MSASNDHPHAARGTLLLSLLSLIWGTTFMVTQNSLEAHYPAARIVLGRFLVASLIFLPFLRRGRRLWMASMELGLILWLGFATQTVGLRYTTVGRSAFITSGQVIFVPILSVMLGRRVRPAVWIASVLALAGVGFLSNDGAPPNIGDAWTLACAVTWAGYVARLETFAPLFPTKVLTACHLWVVTILSAGWALLTPAPAHGTPIPWREIIYLGFAATAATTWLQTVGQQWVTAPRASVLYTMEPLWAVLFAWYFKNQMLGPRGWTGAALILAAAMLTQLPGKAKPVASVAPAPVLIE